MSYNNESSPREQKENIPQFFCEAARWVIWISKAEKFSKRNKSYMHIYVMDVDVKILKKG